MDDARRSLRRGSTCWRTFLVEHYWPGVTTEEFSQTAAVVARHTVRLAEAGRPIRFLHSTLVPTDEATFCVIQAGTRALVEEAYADAGVSYERIVEAVESGAPRGHRSLGERGPRANPSIRP